MSGNAELTFLNQLQESFEVHQELLYSADIAVAFEASRDVCLRAYREQRKLLVAGNGGSAADAQHLAGEFVSRFYLIALRWLLSPSPRTPPFSRQWVTITVTKICFRGKSRPWGILEMCSSPFLPAAIHPTSSRQLMQQRLVGSPSSGSLARAGAR